MQAVVHGIDIIAAAHYGYGTAGLDALLTRRVAIVGASAKLSPRHSAHTAIALQRDACAALSGRDTVAAAEKPYTACRADTVPVRRNLIAAFRNAEAAAQLRILAVYMDTVKLRFQLKAAAEDVQLRCLYAVLSGGEPVFAGCDEHCAVRFYSVAARRAYFKRTAPGNYQPGMHRHCRMGIGVGLGLRR